MKWKIPLALIVVAGAVVIAFNSRANLWATEVWHKIAAVAVPARNSAPALRRVPPDTRRAAKRSAQDSQIMIDETELTAIGLQVVAVKAQTDPMKLEITGITDYDPNTLSKVRPRFASVVARVYVVLGQTVKKGDPLVDLFSSDLAGVKGDYENKMAQWEYDKVELNRAKSLFLVGPGKIPSISEQVYLSAVNEEKKSGTLAKVARDILLVYGLTDDEIEKVKVEDGTEKGRMTLRSPSDGVVIKRDVVQGNRYDMDDVLLVISPLEHFWVYGYVYPSDAARVNLGQNWEIFCPFLGHTFRTKVESVTSDVDKETRTVRIRTRIENLNGRMKADMLVSGFIEIPPQNGRTVVPRLAMVSADGNDYVFVRVRGLAKSTDPSADRASVFERRSIRIAQETHDHVVVADGLKPGEEVATRGSLILAQMYEDAMTTETGAPL